jgi:Pentapeptide repeats (8 copies)
MEQKPKTPYERAEDLLRLLVPDWQPTPQQNLWAIRIAIVLGLLIAIGYAYGITLWEWANLLIVPAAIAGAGLWFTQQQRERELKIADQRAKTDREIVDERRQDDTLQAYLDGMSQLLTDKKQPLHKAPPADTLGTVARARTLTVLSRLDQFRKRCVLVFLHESGLIDREQILVDDSNLIKRRHNIVNLNLADLSDAVLVEADLSGAVLNRADQIGADLSGADLSRAELIGTDLQLANLRTADLTEANLSGADLSGANLTDAYEVIKEGSKQEVTTRVTNEQPEAQQTKSLEGATMPNGQKYEDWLKSRGPGGARRMGSTAALSTGLERWQCWFQERKGPAKPMVGAKGYFADLRASPACW